MRSLLVCFALLGIVGPAAACLNDRELLIHEQEFRSQYQEQKSPSPPVAAEQAANGPSNRVLMGSGIVMLAGAVALSFTGRRPRN